MASIDELAADAKTRETLVVEGDVAPQEDFDPTTQYLRQDILDSISLLLKCSVLMSFMGDKDLCVSITKKERGTMLGLAERVRVFLNGIDPTYEERE